MTSYGTLVAFRGMGTNDGSCRAPGCQNPAHSRGLCHKHYWRLMKNGSLDLPQRMSAEDRFWSKVDKRGPDECWPWLAGGDGQGYGHFKPRSWVGVRAHRFAYELVIGPVPEDKVIDHTCHDDYCPTPGEACPHRRCCNPAHLQLVTNAENVARAVKRHRCPRGHEYTPENTLPDPVKGRVCLTCRTLRGGH